MYLHRRHPSHSDINSAHLTVRFAARRGAILNHLARNGNVISKDEKVVTIVSQRTDEKGVAFEDALVLRKR